MINMRRQPRCARYGLQRGIANRKFSSSPKCRTRLRPRSFPRQAPPFQRLLRKRLSGALLSQQLPSLLRNAGGGGERDRTDDLLLAKQALSQLSYTPQNPGGSGWIRTIDPRLIKTVL